jgi:hypothetical protein
MATPPTIFPSGVRVTSCGLLPFVATRNFPNGAISELIVGWPSALPDIDVAINTIAGNRNRRTMTTNSVFMDYASFYHGLIGSMPFALRIIAAAAFRN